MGQLIKQGERNLIERVAIKVNQKQRNQSTLFCWNDEVREGRGRARRQPVSWLTSI